jgi:transposase
VAWIRHPTIEDYERRRAEFVAAGAGETEAMHIASDAAVSELAQKTRQRRRVERDQLLGVGGHEELLRRYRGNAKLTDARSRRIAKKLLQVSRWATMERALREVGYDEADIGRMMGELTGAFKKSDEAGQAQWKKTRAAVL